MKKELFLRIGIIILVTGLTFSLMANRKQDRKITLSITLQEADLLLKGLGKLPLEESGGLYFNIQQQAQAQLQPPPKKINNPDSTKNKKP